jgi:hypothetical protein
MLKKIKKIQDGLNPPSIYAFGDQKPFREKVSDVSHFQKLLIKMVLNIFFSSCPFVYLRG